MQNLRTLSKNFNFSPNKHCCRSFDYYSGDNLQRQEHARQSTLILYKVYWKNNTLSFFQSPHIKNTLNDKVTVEKKAAMK